MQIQALGAVFHGAGARVYRAYELCLVHAAVCIYRLSCSRCLKATMCVLTHEYVLGARRCCIRTQKNTKVAA